MNTSQATQNFSKKPPEPPTYIENPLTTSGGAPGNLVPEAANKMGGSSLIGGEILKQISRLTTENLRREARENFEEQREFSKSYINSQMNSHFRTQLNDFKLEICSFLRDFSTVKTSESLLLSTPRNINAPSSAEIKKLEKTLGEIQANLSIMKENEAKLEERVSVTSQRNIPLPGIDPQSLLISHSENRNPGAKNQRDPDPKRGTFVIG